MADHGSVSYATATGNDLPMHEGSYERFVHFTLVAILHIICLLFGLAVGGVMGHWFVAIPIFILAIIGLVSGLMSRSTTASWVTFVLSFLIFAFVGVGGLT